MSHKYYDIQLKKAFNQIFETFENELWPLKAIEKDNKLAKKKFSDNDFYQFYGLLYIEYINIYKNLENCYDQIVQPQKRAFLKNILINVIRRLLELRNDLILFNTSTNCINSDFVNLDDILFNFKILPDKIEYEIPNYFKEGIDLIKRNKLIDDLLVDYLDHCISEEEQVIKQYSVENNMKAVLFEIVKIEKGRQAIVEGLNTKKILEKEKKKKMNKIMIDQDDKTNEDDSILIKYYLSYLARKEIYEMRKKESLFLGFDFKYNIDDNNKNFFQKKLEIEKDRKLTQKEHLKNMIEDKKIIKDTLMVNEGNDMKEQMLNDRRKFIIEVFERNEGKDLPKDLNEFYERKNVGIPLTPEEEDLKKKELEKEKKDTKNKDKKKETEEEAFLRQRIKKGPEYSEGYKGIRENLNVYNKEFNTDKENEEINHTHSKDKLIKENLNELEEEIKAEVDQMILLELNNLYIKLGINKKKEKKPKNRNKGKNKNKKKFNFDKEIQRRMPEDILADLINLDICKKLKKNNFKEFIGEFNPIRAEVEKQSEKQPDPSYAQVRQIVKELVALPLGSGIYVNENNINNKTFLFYGPEGTGKSLIARSVINETNSLVFDISSDYIYDKFTDRNSIKMVLQKVFFCAKKYQPSVILIDEVEHYFPKKQVGKKVKKYDKCAKFKKDLLNLTAKALEKDDKVAIIGISNIPYVAHVNDMKKYFYKKIYFPFPDYTSRYFLIKYFIESKKIEIPKNFPLSILANSTNGFTPGSVF